VGPGAKQRLLQNQTTGKNVVNRTIPRNYHYAQAVDDKIIQANDWHMHQQPAGREALTRSPKANSVAPFIGNI